jgi:hypothetical protein
MEFADRLAPLCTSVWWLKPFFFWTCSPFCPLLTCSPCLARQLSLSLSLCLFSLSCLISSLSLSLSLSTPLRSHLHMCPFARTSVSLSGQELNDEVDSSRWVQDVADAIVRILAMWTRQHFDTVVNNTEICSRIRNFIPKVLEQQLSLRAKSSSAGTMPPHVKYLWTCFSVGCKEWVLRW